MRSAALPCKLLGFLDCLVFCVCVIPMRNEIPSWEKQKEKKTIATEKVIWYNSRRFRTKSRMNTNLYLGGLLFLALTRRGAVVLT